MRIFEKYMNHEWFLPILSALFGVILLYRSLHSYADRMQRDAETLDVVIISKGLPDGHILQNDDLETTKVLKRYVPIGAVLTSDLSKVVKQTLIRPAAKGEMLLWSALGYELSPPVPSRKITKGYREMSLLVDEESSIGYHIKPGDHVDLMLTIPQKTSGDSVTLTLLQNIAVLHIGAEEQENQSNYNSIGLMVLPKEAAILQHAKSKGKISFALRNPHDHTSGEVIPYVHDQQLIETAFRQAIQKEHDEAIELIKGPKD